MERITGFMTPRNRQATVALAEEGDDHRLVNDERGAITRPSSVRPLSPSPYNAAVPKGPAFSLLNYW